MVFFNAKTILEGEPRGYYLSHSWGNKGIPTFTKDIILKVNIIAWLELELADFEAAVQHFNHYAIGTHLWYLIKHSRLNWII